MLRLDPGRRQQLSTAIRPTNPVSARRKLFLIARDDRQGGDSLRLPRVREIYAKTTEPKELIIVEGSAHAQFLFETDQGERVMREILRFLTEK
jgi:hypothetical protein